MMKRIGAQKIILLCGAVAFISCGLFPPWLYISSEGHTHATGCHFILSPPTNGNSKLDIARLAVEWICIAVATGIIWLLMSKPEKAEDSKDKTALQANIKEPLNKPPETRSVEAKLEKPIQEKITPTFDETTQEGQIKSIPHKTDHELMAIIKKLKGSQSKVLDAATVELEKRNGITSFVATTPKTITNYTTFRDLSGLTKFLKILLILGAVIGAIAVVSEVMMVEILNRIFSASTDDAKVKILTEVSANDAEERVIALLQSALFLFTVIIFGRWIFLANQNVWSLGATGLLITPGWAVGYFFVPIVCLWKPYQAMKELWRASQNPWAWQNIPASQIVSGWWTLWIISCLFGRAAAGGTISAHTIFDIRTATYTHIISDATDIGLCVIAIVLVSKICSAQTKAANRNA